MICSHGFVERVRMIKDDDEFSKPIFDGFSENERDYMKWVLKRCGIESRQFESAYNQTLDHLVSRMNVLQSAASIGDDNPEIKNEIQVTLDKLYSKSMLSAQYYSQIRRAFSA